MGGRWGALELKGPNCRKHTRPPAAFCLAGRDTPRRLLDDGDSDNSSFNSC